MFELIIFELLSSFLDNAIIYFLIEFDLISSNNKLYVEFSFDLHLLKTLLNNQMDYGFWFRLVMNINDYLIIFL